MKVFRFFSGLVLVAAMVMGSCVHHQLNSEEFHLMKWAADEDRKRLQKENIRHQATSPQLLQTQEVSIEELIGRLDNRNMSMCESALEALVKIGPPAVDSLIRALKVSDGEWFIRRSAAAEALGKIGDERAIQPLAALLMDHVSDGCKNKIVFESARSAQQSIMRSIKDVDVLITMCVKGDEFISSFAAEALGERGEQVVPYLRKMIKILKSEDSTWDDRHLAAINISRVTEYGNSALLCVLVDEAVDFLLACLDSSDTHTGERWEAFCVLGIFDKHPRAMSIFEDPVLCNIYKLGASPWSDPGKTANCKWAAYELGNYRDKRAIEPLKAARGYWWDGKVTAACNDAIDEIECWHKKTQEEKIEELTRVMEDKQYSNSSARVCAMEVLNKIDDERAFDLQINALKDKEYNVCRAAAIVLGKKGDKRAVEPLIELLEDNNQLLREVVAEALGKIGDERAIEALNRTLKDKELRVRLVAKKAIEKIQKSPSNNVPK